MDRIEKAFAQFSDCYADTWIYDESGKPIEGQVIQAMTIGAFEEALNFILKAESKNESQKERIPPP